MIEYIRGEIAELAPTRMIVECGGIGYELNISVTTFSAFNHATEGKVYVMEVIREDAHLLYGFATREERELFLLLTSVSGVGPNTARMILSSLPPPELVNVIASADDVSLTAIKGIGSKTAQRIVVDLKNKVKPVAGLAAGTSTMAGVRTETLEGAVAALVMLGFQKNMSQKAVESILRKTPAQSIEQVIKDALKVL
ncbi:MAG: Holliday junction branch migration protein RuvA [Tannerella sp.]|jgi:Holliday junction DNA helicase RuvA|nr:Holliday junction branch migration protein RuvA [Tannerella sp.]